MAPRYNSLFLALLFAVSLVSSTTNPYQHSPMPNDAITDLMHVPPTASNRLRKRVVGPLCASDPIDILGLVKTSDCVEAHRDPRFQKDAIQRRFGYAGFQLTERDVVLPLTFSHGTCMIVLDIADRTRDDVTTWAQLKQATWLLIDACANQVQGYGVGGMLYEFGEFKNIALFIVSGDNAGAERPPLTTLRNPISGQCFNIPLKPDGTSDRSCAGQFDASRSQQQCFMPEFYDRVGSNSPQGLEGNDAASDVPYSWALPAAGYCSNNDICCTGYECVLNSFSRQVWALLFGVVKTAAEGVGSCLVQTGGSRRARREELGVGSHPSMGKSERRSKRRKCLCSLTFAHAECCRGGSMVLE
ncbi:MAG: hypothetical protein M1836_006036 [Candelina mexicana]|nr:MAG: hypothetical protein M1836_006036 [Candelina mexicana]